MNKTIIYIRASSEAQAYDQQLRSITVYLNGKKPDKIFSEKESGSKKHDERILIKAIEFCQPSDTIIVSEFSRLSRSMGDAANIIALCIKNGVNVISIKENLHIRGDQPEDLTTKLLSLVFGLAAEIELSNLKSRTKSGINVVKDNIKKDGFAIGKKSGRRFTQLGNPNISENAHSGCMASAAARRAKKQGNVNFKQTYEVARLWRENGLKIADIALKLNQSGYKTSKGFGFMGATVSRLLNDGKKLLKKQA